jgi:hypothetical protein
MKGNAMKPSKPSPRRLKVESLEHRCLTASLSGATAFTPTSNTFEVGYELSGPQTPSLTPTVALVRGYELVSGLRMNHNETLARARRRSGHRN